MLPLGRINSSEAQSPKSKSSNGNLRRKFRFDFASTDQKAFSQIESTPKQDNLSNTLKKRASSPENSPKSVNMGPNKPKITLKTLKTGYLDEDVVYDSLEKLHGILKHQKTISEQVNNRSLKDSQEKEESIAAKRNKQLMKLIKRYQSEKQMILQSKESKFESRLKTFKSLKTFVTVQNAMRGLLDAQQDMNLIKAKSETIKSTPVDGLRESQKTPSRTLDIIRSRSVNTTPIDQRLEARFNEQQGKESFKLGDKLMPIEIEDEKEQMSNMIQHLEENIKRHLGPEGFDMIRCVMSDPKRSRELQKRTNLEIHRIKETKRTLDNNDLLNSLMDHLATQTKPKTINVAEDEEGANNSPFYKKLERDLYQETVPSTKKIRGKDEQKEEETKTDKEAYKRNLLRKLQSSSPFFTKNDTPNNEEIGKKNELGGLAKAASNETDNENQIKVVNLLNNYHERTEKVIRLLRRKATLIHQKSYGSIKTSRAESISSKYRPSRGVEFQENSTPTNKFPEEEEKRAPSLPVVEKSSAKRSVCFGTHHHEENFVLAAQLPVNRQDRTSSSIKSQERRRTGHSSSKPLLMNSDNYYSVPTEEVGPVMEGTSSVTRRCCAQVRERASLFKEGKAHHSYEKSMKGIQGMLNTLSETNKKFETELKDTRKTIETFYSDKLNGLTEPDLPESLNVPASTEFNKKTELIMKLTKRVLRDQVL